MSDEVHRKLKKNRPTGGNRRELPGGGSEKGGGSQEGGNQEDFRTKGEERAFGNSRGGVAGGADRGRGGKIPPLNGVPGGR